MSTGRLVDALWEEDLPADQVHALQSLVSRLRRALGNGSLVAPAPGGYRLDVEVDAQHFERLVADARRPRRGDHEREGELLREALALWRGPALADLVDYRFAAAAAARLEDLSWPRWPTASRRTSRSATATGWSRSSRPCAPSIRCTSGWPRS